jgi:hypothetical protein
MVFLLMVEQLLRLLRKSTKNIILKRFIPIIMICHIFSVDIQVPKPADQFNLRIMKIFTLDFGLFKECSTKTTVLDSIGYLSTSPIQNMRTIGLYLIIIFLCNLFLQLSRFMCIKNNWC